MNIYLIGSLRNPDIPALGIELRVAGHTVFDDWFAAGERADDAWKDYEQFRGHTYIEALAGLSAKHVFEFDRKHLYEADAGVLMMPAGKSGHIELGILIGRGKPTFILLEENSDRWDVMYRFADGVFTSKSHLLAALRAC